MKSAFREHHIVVGIGEILWDMLPEKKRLGGAPTNFASHAAAIGGQARIVSAIGQDQSGLDILERLSNKEINTQHIQFTEHPTGWVDVKICSNGHPEYIIHENVAWDYIPLSPQTIELAQTCDAVCFGSLAQRNPFSRESIQQFLANTREDCLRVFDINLRQHYYSREILENSFQAATILKLNDDELTVLRNLFELPEPQEAALQALLDQYQLDCIAFTEGARGSMMMDTNNVSYCPAIPITVKDTIGAGDAFTATMVMGKLYGLSLEKINQLAGKVAAHVCSQAGATPTLPARLIAELKQELSIPIREIIDTSSAQKTHKRGLRKVDRSIL